MILIVGLGNPGKKFNGTRHNIGFLVLDEFQKVYNFPDFELVKKFISLVSRREILGKKIALAKPQTFMNKSGEVVKALTKFYKIPRVNLLVIHDDIDLPLGKMRISKGRGSAGHKGVESIIKYLGTKNFVRLRIGIQPKEKPADSSAVRRARQNAKLLAGFVLQKFAKDEEKIVKKIIKTSCQALKTALTESTEKAMSKYNK